MKIVPFFLRVSTSKMFCYQQAVVSSNTSVTNPKFLCCKVRMPKALWVCRRVRSAERFSWVATRGVNEEELLSNLPEDIQRGIRRHFFGFLKKVC